MKQKKLTHRQREAKRIIARIIIKDGPNLTTQEVFEVATWLRRQATWLTKNSYLLSQTFTGKHFRR